MAAYDEIFKMSLQDKAGNYYTASQTTAGIWSIGASAGTMYIKTLPKGWDQFTVKWERDTNYYGIFRSQANAFEFTQDARAILLNMMIPGDGGGVNGAGIEAYATLTVYIWNEATFAYDVYYQSQIDFAKAANDVQNEFLKCGTIDSWLYKHLQALQNASYNIPFWKQNSAGDWHSDAQFVKHNGIKLLYSSSFTGSATDEKPIFATLTGPPVVLYGFNDGSRSDGRHWLPAMSNVSIVQNNGTTTYVGNDILQPFLLQGTQLPSYEGIFWGNNDSRPYSRKAYLICNQLSAEPIKMSVTLDVTFADEIDYDNFSVFDHMFIGFVLFEIDKDDFPGGITATTGTGTPPSPGTVSGNMQYINLDGGIPGANKLYLPNTGSPFAATGMTIHTVTELDVKYQHCYVLGVILDDEVVGISGYSLNNALKLSKLELSINSNYDSGATGIPVNGPAFNPSPVMAFRPSQVLSKLAPCLNSTQTDPYGFPIIPVDTVFAGVSDFLSNATLDPNTNYDNVPYKTVITSKNALQVLPGQPYISMSISDFFNICFKTWACGLGIEGNNIRIEPLSYFFNDTMILDLGENIYGLNIEPMDDQMFCNIQAGYSSQSTNNDFGIENVWNEQDYITPMLNAPNQKDFKNSSAIAGVYAIEKARVQQVSSSLPISGSSGDNTNILLEIGDLTLEELLFEDPAGELQDQFIHNLKQYPTAQNTTPSSAPYIRGCWYPDTMYNLGITPAKNLLRLGSFLHSWCDEQDSRYITFRKQYQMLQNGVAEQLPGISTNLGAGLVDEVADIAIGALPTQLFRPFKLSFTSDAPVNMYQIMNANPRGYVRIVVKPQRSFGAGVVLKGFIWEVSQKAGTNATTEWALICHPSITDEMIRAASGC